VNFVNADNAIGSATGIFSTLEGQTIGTLTFKNPIVLASAAGLASFWTAPSGWSFDITSLLVLPFVSITGNPGPLQKLVIEGNGVAHIPGGVPDAFCVFSIAATWSPLNNLNTQYTAQFGAYAQWDNS
jgi:hypothetical protein